MAHGKEAGLTLMEVLIAVSLSAVAIALAGPELSAFIKNHRMATHKNVLFAHLNYARYQSVLRSQRVVACPSADSRVCLRESDWHRGWIVFVDEDLDREHDPAEELLRVGPAVTPPLSLTTPLSRRRIRYMPTGYAPGSNATFVFCDDRGSEFARALILSNAGRLRDARKGPGGRDLRCPGS